MVSFWLTPTAVAAEEIAEEDTDAAQFLNLNSTTNATKEEEEEEEEETNNKDAESNESEEEEEEESDSDADNGELDDPSAAHNATLDIGLLYVWGQAEYGQCGRRGTAFFRPGLEDFRFFVCLVCFYCLCIFYHHFLK